MSVQTEFISELISTPVLHIIKIYLKDTQKMCFQQRIRSKYKRLVVVKLEPF